MTSSIVLTCDAGIPVVLLGDSALANELGVVTEDLLADGAQVELVTGIGRAPARLAEAVQRARTPTLFVLCRRGPSANAQALQALFEQVAAHDHRWLDCDLETTTATLCVRRITAELAELSSSHHGAEPSVPCDSAIDALFEDAPARGSDDAATKAQEVSGVVSLAEPRLLAPPKAPSDRPRRTRKASLFVALATVSTAVLIAAAWPRERPVHEGAIAAELSPVVAVSAPLETKTTAPSAVLPKRVPQPPVELEPARIEIPVPVLVPVLGTVEPPPPAAPGDRRTQLDIAIERQHVSVHGGLVVAEAIMGERTWAEAMTACRARPFWHVRGWRVPTRKELVTLARAGLLPKARVWSATRGDRRSITSFVVDGHDAAVSAEPRTDASAVTICVKRR